MSNVRALKPAPPCKPRSRPEARHGRPFASAIGYISAILCAGILALASASCTHHRQARVFVPPPSQPRPFVLPPKPDLPEAPQIEAKTEAEIPPDSFSTIPVLPPPPAPPRRPPVVAAPKPVPPPPVAEPPSPRLSQIFTADQLREYNRTLDESLTRVRTVLAVAGGRKLTPQQTEMVARIRTFLQQAEQARQQDLVTAVNLARRADLLARELSGSLP